MKTIQYAFYVMILLILNSASIQAQNCQDAQPQAINLVQKIDDHHYEIYAYGQQSLLITHRAVYTKTGELGGIKVKSKNRGQRVQLNNGFTTIIPVYEECAIVPYSSHPNQVIRGPFAAWRKPLKEDFK